MDIDLRLLRSFVQMQGSGSLARAAERLACTPAAIFAAMRAGGAVTCVADGTAPPDLPTAEAALQPPPPA